MPKKIKEEAMRASILAALGVRVWMTGEEVYQAEGVEGRKARVLELLWRMVGEGELEVVEMGRGKKYALKGTPLSGAWA